MLDPNSSFISDLKLFAEKLKEVDCKPKQVQMEIDGLVYTNTKLPASIGLEIWPRLVSLFGSGFIRTATGDDEDGDFSIEMIVRIANKATADGLVALLRDLMARTQCNKLATTGNPGNVLSDFDEHFAGEYAHLLKVAAFAISHNLRGPTRGNP